MIFTDSRNLLPIPKLGKSCRNLRHDRVEPLAAQADSGQWGQQGALLRPRLGWRSSLECRIYSTYSDSDDCSSYKICRYQWQWDYTGNTGNSVAIVWQWPSGVRPPPVRGTTAAPPRPARTLRLILIQYSRYLHLYFYTGTRPLGMKFTTDA